MDVLHCLFVAGLAWLVVYAASWAVLISQIYPGMGRAEDEEVGEDEKDPMPVGAAKAIAFWSASVAFCVAGLIAIQVLE